ncbi:MAG: hypothetical protein Q9197_003410 [Variospora fuerteventurae]
MDMEMYVDSYHQQSQADFRSYVLDARHLSIARQLTTLIRSFESKVTETLEEKLDYLFLHPHTDPTVCALIAKNDYYNLATNNCQIFATNLAKRVKEKPPVTAPPAAAITQAFDMKPRFAIN